MFDIIPASDICNKKSDNLDENKNEEYDDIIDNSLFDNKQINKKNNLAKLLVTILCYLNYVNNIKKSKILIKSKL